MKVQRIGVHRMAIPSNEFIDWLLAAKTPAVRYKTLRHLLGRDSRDAVVQATLAQAMNTHPISTILNGQTSAGNWSPERTYYSPKYFSTHWSMLLLTEFDADGSDPRLRRGANFMLAATKDRLDAAIASGESGLSCFWGNLLRYCLHCGPADDPRIAPVVQFIARDATKHTWRCKYNDNLSCAWGAARALWGLAALPVTLRSPETDATIEAGLDFLLTSHDLSIANYPPDTRINPLWFRLNFPLFYQADILFALRVSAELDALHHVGAKSALEWLADKRMRNGRWRGSSPYRKRTWERLADKEDTNRWVSLHAALILQQVSHD
jgi:hypothetical protein